MESITVSIFKRSGQRVWQMQYRDPTTGNKIRRSTGERTESKARKAAGKWEAEINEDRDMRSSGRMAWAEFRRQFEDRHLASLARETEHKYGCVLNVFERHASPRRLCDITEQTMSEYQQSLWDLGHSVETVKSHLAHIQAALNWAKTNKLLKAVPTIAMPKRAAKKADVMKGRPITSEEFERMLVAVDKVIRKQIPGKCKKDWKPDPEKAATWKHYLRGMWWSGLRLTESMELHWTDERQLHPVDIESKEPLLFVPRDLEKGNRNRLMPMAPEFAEFLRETPLEHRRGFVFDPQPMRQRYNERLTAHRVGELVTEIGEAAGVVVNRKTKIKNGEEVEAIKFASAQDLRRSFGERWAPRLMPAILKELMRHASIETTMRYYVGSNAQRSTRVLWDAYRGSSVGASLGASPSEAPSEHEGNAQKRGEK